MRLAITGGRDRKPTPMQLAQLGSLIKEYSVTEVLHGDCRGIDRAIARWLAEVHPSIVVTAMPADWRKRGSRVAGPLRNAAMMARADALANFGGGRGTADCERAALRLGKIVHKLTP